MSPTQCRDVVWLGPGQCRHSHVGSCTAQRSLSLSPPAHPSASSSPLPVIRNCVKADEEAGEEEQRLQGGRARSGGGVWGPGGAGRQGTCRRAAPGSGKGTEGTVRGALLSCDRTARAAWQRCAEGWRGRIPALLLIAPGTGCKPIRAKGPHHDIGGQRSVGHIHVGAQRSNEVGQHCSRAEGGAPPRSGPVVPGSRLGAC